MEFAGVSKKEPWNSRVQLKKEVEFSGVLKKNAYRIFMDLGFWPWKFEGVSQNFQGWKLVFPGISKAKGKMTNLKIPRERGSEHYILNPLHLFDKWQKRF